MTRAISNQSGCPTCEIEGFSRNHYFNGKLLVERDFTDEQRYYIDKARYHNQRLHGWGVVCGLKVKQHPNETCRDRFVCVEPGSAVDCCGHDLILREEDCIDFTTLEPIKNLKAQNDQQAHVLQICLRYKECPTEDVPVLYDDCGCDEAKCAPNRILESYELGVILDPKKPDGPMHSPRLSWQNTLNLAHAARVAIHAATQRLYILAADSPGVVYQLDAATNAVITSHNLPATGRAVLVSNAGNRVYVIADPVAPATVQQLHVLDASQPNLPLIQAASLPINNSTAATDVVPVVAPDGRLLALISNNGDVVRWATDIDTQTAPAAAQVVANLGANLSSLALSSDGGIAYAGGTSNVVQVLTLATQAKSTINVPAGAQISAFAVLKSTGSDILAVGDSNGNSIHVVKLNPFALAGTVQLDHAPAGLVSAPGGHWVYVLERDGAANKSYLQAVDVHALLLQSPLPPTTKFEVSHPAQQIVISESGERLLVPFTGDMTQPASGGVAIIDVTEDACSEILWRHLEGCPHCDLPNCVVLATIKDYHVGEKIVDGRIDNRTDRKVLASTELLQEMIECVMEHGGAGGIGPQGPPGPNGLGIDDVVATIIPCDQVPAKPTLQVIAGQRTLTLEIPRGCDGDDAPGQPPVDLTHICATSWKHGGEVRRVELQEKPLIIAFDNPIEPKDINAMTIRVLVRHEEEVDNGVVQCWCEVPLKPLEGIQLKAPCKIDSERVTPPVEVNAASFQLTWVPRRGQTCRVIVNGDFIRDKNKRAIDANHLPPWLSGGRPTGDGVEGGTFESWLVVT